MHNIENIEYNDGHDYNSHDKTNKIIKRILVHERTNDFVPYTSKYYINANDIAGILIWLEGYTITPIQIA